MSKAKQPPPRLFYGSIREFAAANGIGVDLTYALIREKKLVARKCGAKSIILIEDAERALRALPELELAGGSDQQRA